MKSNSSIQLNKKWWGKEQPDKIKDSTGKRFLSAIGEFETANEALGKAVANKKSDLSDELRQVERKIAQLETSGLAAAKEIAGHLKPAPRDARERRDLENTLAVMGKPLARELDSIRGAVAAMEDEAGDGDLKNVNDFKLYLVKMLPRLRKGAFSFAVVVPSSNPEDIRMDFHRTKAPKALAGPLHKASGGGKFTWGIAAAEKKMDETEEESGNTLVLALDGKVLPGLAKKIKKMFQVMEVQTFKKVKLLVDGVVVETDETPEGELPNAEADEPGTDLPDLGPGVLPDAPDVADDLPEGGASDSELNVLFKSYQDLKRKIVPLIGPAVQRYPEQKAEFAALVKALRKAETDEEFDKGIAILRDRVVPLLKSSQRMASANDGNDADIGKVDVAPSPQAARDELLNTGLQRVLARTFPPANQSKWEVFKSGSGKKITSGADFFKGVKVKYPKNETPENAEQLREFAINMSMLQHILTKVAEDSPEAKALKKRQLGYLLKFANIPNTGDLGWQANPTQIEDSGKYHRSGSSKLTNKVTELTANELGVPVENTILVSDRRVLEEIHRDYNVEGELKNVEGWTDDDYDTVLRHVLEGKSSFIDCTKLFKTALDADADPKTKVEEIIVKLKERAFANAVAGRGKPGMTADDLAALGTPADRSVMTEEQIEQDKKRVAEEERLKTAIENDHKMALSKLGNVRMGGVMASGEQQALVTYPFDAAATVGGDADLKLGASDTKGMRGLVGHSGFTVGPEQLLDHWVSQTPNVADILRGLGVAELPTVEFPSGKRLDQFQDFSADFLGSDAVKGFGDLADEYNAPPYVKVMVEGMMSMVEGLQLGEHGFSVKSCLEDAGLGELWSLTLNKIQGLMAKATACKGSMRDFLDQIALIQEEVTTLIAVAKPYSVEDFQRGMVESTDMFPHDFLGDDISADFSLKNSASRCFNSVLTACEDTKELLQGKDGHLAKRGLSVLVQGDSYYEPSLYVLDHAKDHSQTGLDTTGLQVGQNEQDFDDQLDEMERAQREDGKAKLDTFLCEFHHNISYDRKHYSPEDVTRQVRKLITKGVVANPFTVAIDTTIAKTDEANVKAFLTAFKQEIKDGEMNVVIYRSAQKFDQMGADSYNGGIMCCISANGDGGEPSPFNRALDSTGELPSEDNMQGLAHLNLSGQEEVNNYRSAIMENTRKMGDPAFGSPAAIPRHMMATQGNANASMIQIAVNEDDEAPFLDIKFPFVQLADEPEDHDTPEWHKWNGEKDRYTALYTHLQKLFTAKAADDPENAVTSTRASFGFQHSNVTLIEPVKLRLNPGLEDEARLKELTDLLVAANDMLMAIKTDFATTGDLEDGEVEKLAFDTKVINLAVVEAHKELTGTLADGGASEKKKDQARLKMAEIWCAAESMKCANPPGVLKLIADMSDDFKRKNRRRIEACENLAQATYDAIRSRTPEQTLLAEASAAKSKGVVQEVASKLMQIAQGAAAFEDRSSDQRKYNDLDRWVIEHYDDWTPQAEELVQTAIRARAANDPIACKAALDKPMTANFKLLRESDIDPLLDWVNDTYVKRNKTAAEDLIALARSRIEIGAADDAERYVKHLEDMVAKNLPGLPDGLGAKITDLKRASQEGEAARRIDQALSDAAEHEAVGKSDEVAKRVAWVDKIVQAVPGVANEDQTGELLRLKEWLRTLEIT